MRLFQNFYLKILSLLLGLTLWFYVQGRETVETSLKLTLFFSDIQENLYLDEISHPEITVWLKGGKHVISQILKTEKRIDLNLKGYREGRHTLSITPFMINLPKNIEITRIQPEKIWVRLVPFMQKKVTVKADYNGKRSFVIYPSSILIKGEKKVVENIENIYTEPFSDDKNKKEIYVKIVVPSEKVKPSSDKVKIVFR